MSKMTVQEVALQIFLHKDVGIEIAYSLAEEFLRIGNSDNKVENDVKQIDDIFNQPIDCLETTVRTMNCLKAQNIRTIKDLVAYSQLDLLKLPSLGKKCFNEVKEAVGNMGLTLGMSESQINDYCYGDDYKTYKYLWISDQLCSIQSALQVPHLGSKKRQEYIEQQAILREKIKEFA